VSQIEVEEQFGHWATGDRESTENVSAQVRGVDADALIAFRIRVVGVLFPSALI
jgi:hypothetical protein